MNKTVCVFGDSITHGSDDFENGGWFGRLQKKFDVVDTWTNFYNLGIPGDTTAGLLERLAQEVAPRKPDVIIIAIGINDTQWLTKNEKVRVSEEDFKSNIIQVLEISKKISSSVLVVGLTRVDEAYTRPYKEGKEYRNEIISRYDDLLRAQVLESGIAYVDVSDALRASDIEDGVHPNAAGHEKIFKQVLPVVEKILAS